ncbi:PepSY-associated TM helix domain-containing protein [Oxalicibacterium faecigallinarum]|uniref:Membrane protein n=1 Tax=Oxalicibacterium faecigallinarum TaxID=573741 RepID=A0A8J3AYB2_9BURK|nr:PepSY-associated TM helix domain-containing protein [Oxalicibacterium faecigallinarum]GGI19304.1 membrane protein [Oxalicibacterium faecigallinarum]
MESTASSPQAHLPNQRRAWWLRQLYQWHWISAAISLLCMLIFSATGITLNNAEHIEARPEIKMRTAQLPEKLTGLLASWDNPDKGKNPALPVVVSDWLKQNLSADVRQRDVDWSPDEIYISMPRPGGDSWLRIDRESGEVEYETTTRGWISYLNDLHKGRHTGLAWRWLIDFFAGACLLFALTGLFILKMHAANRPSTWPLVGIGVVLPIVLAMLFIH